MPWQPHSLALCVDSSCPLFCSLHQLIGQKDWSWDAVTAGSLSQPFWKHLAHSLVQIMRCQGTRIHPFISDVSSPVSL